MEHHYIPGGKAIKCRARSHGRCHAMLIWRPLPGQELPRLMKAFVAYLLRSDSMLRDEVVGPANA